MPIQTSYYPYSIEGRANWWQNILDNMPIIQALQPSMADSIMNDAQAAVYLYRTLPQVYDKFTVEVHGYCNSYLTGADGMPAPTPPPLPAWPKFPSPAVLAGIEKRREKWVQLLKNTAGYDPQVTGVTMRTEIVGGNFDQATYAAEVSEAVSLSPAHVQAKFAKGRGKIDSMEFSGRKIGTTAMVALGRFSVSPASLAIPIATQGVAEEWEIQGRAVKNDQLIGVASMLMPVLVRG
ncbi:MAG: hypothetical protein M3Z22_06715 [Verrucomicrobiota bacterium]|nr:hypothetical protein [Verrucomicrobiota bacterium]